MMDDFKLNGGSTINLLFFSYNNAEVPISLLQVQILNHVIFQAIFRILCTIQKKWLSRDKQQNYYLDVVDAA